MHAGSVEEEAQVVAGHVLELWRGASLFVSRSVTETDLGYSRRRLRANGDRVSLERPGSVCGTWY